MQLAELRERFRGIPYKETFLKKDKVPYFKVVVSNPTSTLMDEARRLIPEAAGYDCYGDSISCRVRVEDGQIALVSISDGNQPPFDLESVPPPNLAMVGVVERILQSLLYQARTYFQNR